jgi:hypothetical protein
VKPITNGSAIRQGLIPCETNPATGGLSRTGEMFHARAAVTVGSQKANLRHVCDDCAARFHSYARQRSGILWE